MSIIDLSVQGIRSFKNLTSLKFAIPDGSTNGSGLNMLVGPNNSGKSSLIDVVDEYGAMIKACNMHTIFANPYYVPFGDITITNYTPGQMLVVDGIEERIERITEVDINTV